MKSFLATAFGLYCLGIPTHAQISMLPADCERLLATKFRSWKLASIQPEIIEYFKKERPHEQPNIIKGDWNGDGKIDYATMLQAKSDSERRITVAFLKSENSYRTYVLGAADCLMSMKRGERDYSFDSGKYFRYKNDAIFDYIWEKAGVSYVWARDRFRIITTSD